MDFLGMGLHSPGFVVLCEGSSISFVSSMLFFVVLVVYICSNSVWNVCSCCLCEDQVLWGSGFTAGFSVPL